MNKLRSVAYRKCLPINIQGELKLPLPTATKPSLPNKHILNCYLETTFSKQIVSMIDTAIFELFKFERFWRAKSGFPPKNHTIKCTIDEIIIYGQTSKLLSQPMGSSVFFRECKAQLLHMLSQYLSSNAFWSDGMCICAHLFRNCYFLDLQQLICIVFGNILFMGKGWAEVCCLIFVN